MSTHNRIFVRLEDNERFQIVCFNKTWSFDQLVQEVATTLQVPALGALLLDAGVEAAVEVGAVGHIRDGDKCIFVPSKSNPPPEIAAPNEKSQDRDQETAVDLTSKDSSDDDDDEEEEMPKKGSRFLYKHGGVMYPVLLYKRNGRFQNPGKGKCYIQHNGMRGMAWEGYKGPIRVEVSELVTYTKEREPAAPARKTERAEKKEEQKCPEKDKKKKGRKPPTSTAKQQKRKRKNEKEKDESSSDEEEEDGEQVNVEDIEVGSRFFVLVDNEPYPAIVNKLPGTMHNITVIQDETCHMKWIGFRDGHIVNYSDLLPYTEARVREYKERMQTIKETSKKAPDTGKKRKERKRPASKAKQQKRKGTSDKEEEESSSNAEEDDGEQDNVEDIEVGSRFFILDNDVLYPAVVNKLPGKIHNKNMIQEETCHMKWIGYGGGKIVNYSDLLPYTEARLSVYQEFQKQATAAWKAEEVEKAEQVRKNKNRKVEQERGARKRKKMEKKQRKEEELDRLYGPPTDISGLVELGRENQVEG